MQQGEPLWAGVQRRIAERELPRQSWWIDCARPLMSRLGMERGRSDLLEPEVRAGVLRALEMGPDSVVRVGRRLLLARGDAQGALALLDGARRSRALAPLAPDRGRGAPPTAALGQEADTGPAQAEAARAEGLRAGPARRLDPAR
ncbi:MAG: hypothetical protein RL227_15 [Pseudomonadota bacterium]